MRDDFNILLTPVLFFYCHSGLWAGVQVNIDSSATWIPGQARNDRKKMSPEWQRRKRCCMTEERKNAALWQERINSKIPGRFSAKNEGWLYGGTVARNCGMIVSEKEAGGTREKDSNFAFIQKNSPCFLADLH